jgi:hypothetical protein
MLTMEYFSTCLIHCKSLLTLIGTIWYHQYLELWQLSLILHFKHMGICFNKIRLLGRKFHQGHML